MIILTAGHTGPDTGAQCAATHFDEGAENIWLRNRIAEILTNKYGLVVLVDDDTASLKLLVKALTDDLSHTDNMSHTEPKVFEPKVKKLTDNTEEIKTCLLGRDFAQQKQDHYVKEKSSYVFLSKNPTSTASPQSVQIRRATSCAARERIEEKEEKESERSVPSVGDKHSEGVKICVNPPSVFDEVKERIEEKEEKESERSVPSVGDKTSRSDKNSVHSVRDKELSVCSEDIVIDLHFNAHSNPQARGTEAIVADDATTLELRFASRLSHATANALEIPLRGIKSESQTPHRRLAMLHLTPQSIILEVCFITSPEDVEMYRKHRRKIANALAKNIAELIQDH